MSELADFLDNFAATIEKPLHRELFDYWRSKAQPGKLPARSDIDPVDIPRCLPWIIILEVARQGGDSRFRFRLVGTGNIERYGRDVTGEWFEDIYEPGVLERQIAVYSAVARNGRPSLTTQTMPRSERSFMTYHRLLLPFASDGKTVDHILGLMVFD